MKNLWLVIILLASFSSGCGLGVDLGNKTISPPPSKPKEANPLYQGLILYMHFDESSYNGTAGEVLDSSNTGNSGYAVAGTTVTTSGKFKNATSFNVSGTQFIAIPYSSSLENLTVATVSVWFKTSGNGWIFSNNGSLGGGIGLELVSNNLCVSGNSTTCGTATVNDNLWHSAIATWDGSNSTLYYDGALVLNFANTFNANDLDAQVGASCSTSGSTACSWFLSPGSVDDLAVWNRVLTAAEISKVYSASPF